MLPNMKITSMNWSACIALSCFSSSFGTVSVPCLFACLLSTSIYILLYGMDRTGSHIPPVQLVQALSDRSATPSYFLVRQTLQFAGTPECTRTTALTLKAGHYWNNHVQVYRREHFSLDHCTHPSLRNHTWIDSFLTHSDAGT